MVDQIASIDTELPKVTSPATSNQVDSQWPEPYYYSEGLRRVAPYHFTYNTFCKERWRGRGILDIFAVEFRDRTREYYKHAIETGQIAINGKPCKNVHTVVKNGDVVTHTLHRHEPPVTAQPIRVIEETESMIVIDKPAGVPVHPAGRYKYNSVVEIMRAERKAAFNPLPCNRLDRLTSGVMFIAKEKKEAERISEKLRSRTMQKEYVARVKGRFPDGEGEISGNLGGVVKCEENILQISPILGLNRARASGKTAKTLFKRIVYHPPKQGLPASCEPGSEEKRRNAPDASLPAAESSQGYSIVHCLPLTGRTHQIRVHLQFLGHPITNDPIYANRRVFGSKLAIHDSSPAQDEEIMRQLAKMGKTEVADAIDYDNKSDLSTHPPDETPEVDQVDQTMQICIKPENEDNSSGNQPAVPSDQQAKATTTTTNTEPRQGALPFSTQEEYFSFVAQHDAMVSDYNKRRGERKTGDKCPTCLTDLYSDPGPHELGIYLHALSYSDEDGMWEVRSQVPDWALLLPSNRGKCRSRSVRRCTSRAADLAADDDDDDEHQDITLQILGRGWMYDGSEVPPVEVDRQALNLQGLKRNKKKNQQ